MATSIQPRTSIELFTWNEQLAIAQYCSGAAPINETESLKPVVEKMVRNWGKVAESCLFWSFKDLGKQLGDISERFLMFVFMDARILIPEERCMSKEALATAFTAVQSLFADAGNKNP